MSAFPPPLRLSWSGATARPSRSAKREGWQADRESVVWPHDPPQPSCRRDCRGRARPPRRRPERIVAAVSRTLGRRGRERSRAAGHLERDENVAWTADVPGMGWSSPVVWGDHVFVTSVVNTGADRSRRSPGSIWAENWPASTAPHRWMVLRPRLRDRQAAVVEGSEQRRAAATPKHLKNSYASETPVTDGERVYFYFGNVGLFAFDLKGDARLVEADRPVQDAQRLGHGGIARRSTATASTSSTTTTSSRSSPRTTSGPARRSGASTATKARNWATPFVWENERPHRDRHRRAPDKVRSYDLDGQAAVGAQGDVEHQHPDAVRSARAAVHLVRATSAIRIARPTRSARARPATSR